MLLEFIAALASGFAAFGVLKMINAFTGRRLPRWTMPAAAGLGMLAFTIWSEYSWPERAILPGSGYQEASRNSVTAWYRPWTFLWPQSNRMIAIDNRFTRTHPEAPDLVLTRVALIERWMPEYGYLVVFDCAEGLQADLLAGVELMPDGTLEGAEWVPIGTDDAVLRTACAARGGANG